MNKENGNQTTGAPDWRRDDRPCEDEGYATDLMTREACRMIRETPAGQPAGQECDGGKCRTANPTTTHFSTFAMPRLHPSPLPPVFDKA